MKKILIVFGTRPEAIKFAPLIKEIKKHNEEYDLKVCVTSQHVQMLDPVLSFFNIKPDYNLKIMKPNQDLFDISNSILLNIKDVLVQFKPDMVMIQGDTTTAFISAYAANIQKIKVAHLEAGLRSFNKLSPFPEEINRILTSHITDYHFTPTIKASQNLFSEGITKNIWHVGNTVIDALHLGLKIINEKEREYQKFFSFLDTSKKIILVTGHRRESFGEPFRNICFALKEIALNHPNVTLVYPVHLNPNVQEPVKELLKNINNIHLIDPLDYPYLIWLLQKSYFVITDSGGIQEEAPSLGKPVLVMRDVTERMEGVETGNALLVGTDTEKIYNAANRLLLDVNLYNKMAKAENPYGDGKSSERIIQILKDVLTN